MSESTPVIAVESLCIQFPSGSKPALTNLSFRIDAGKTLALLGENGSGKSLIALALVGLLPSNAQWSGRIEFSIGEAKIQIDSGADETDWVGLRGSVLSLVFQEPEYALNPVMQVGKQIAEAMSAQGHASGSMARFMARDWLAKMKFSDPDQIYNSFPHQLSGGQKQKVKIAMALCGNPALLIADEPTFGLDICEQREIMDLIRSLQAETGAALLLITQDLAFASELADDVLVLRHGEMQEYGPASKVMRFPESVCAKALLACRPNISKKGRRLPVLADFLGDETPTPQIFPELKSGAQALLKVRQLRVWYPGERRLIGPPAPVLRAVEDISFDLLRGEVLGLIGVSGCGKSSVSKALVGLQPVESGTIHFAGVDLTHQDDRGWKEMRRKIQMIFQDPNSSLNPKLTIGNQLREVLRVHRIVPNRELDQECRRLMRLVELPEDWLGRYPHECNREQRLRMCIARAVAVRPELIICDECVTAFDVNVQAQILNLLKALQSELNLSYLFISNDLNAVYYMSDHVLVMHEGKILERGTADKVLRDPEHEYTRELIAAMPPAF